MKLMLTQRIQSLVQLGYYLDNVDEALHSSIVQHAEQANPWFTPVNIQKAIDAIRNEFLQPSALNYLAQNYCLDDNISVKKVGIICAGNIPLVGWHDIMCTYLCGHQSIIKYSEKDAILIPYLLKELHRIDPHSAWYFQTAEKLVDYDAIIATGSDSTAIHFQHYFSHVPHIIRKNRNSVAILRGDENIDELRALSTDIFNYFGLGCRNVTKIFVPKGYNFSTFLSILDAYEPYKMSSKYQSNYEYNLAVLLLNQKEFYQGNSILLVHSEKIGAAVATLNYEYYDHIDTLGAHLQKDVQKIQCVVSKEKIAGFEIIPFGQSQCPTINTYADGVDTINFLLGL